MNTMCVIFVFFCLFFLFFFGRKSRISQNIEVSKAHLFFYHSLLELSYSRFSQILWFFSVSIINHSESFFYVCKKSITGIDFFKSLASSKNLIL